MIKFISDRRNKDFMRMWWSQLISQFGDRLNQMALIGLIAERSPGSAMDLAKLLAFTIIPVFIVGPIAGVLVDRWDLRRTLFVCDILRGILVLSIPLLWMSGASMVPIYIVVFLAFCFSRFYIPAKMSIIPDLVVEEHLLMANTFMTTTGMIAFVLGCALGGFLVDIFGARGGFFGDALTFFVSAGLIMSIRRDFRVSFNRRQMIKRGGEILRMEKSLVGELVDGFRYLVALKEIRFVINMLFILLAAAGSVYVVIIVFIQQSFESVTRDLGVLAVFLGVGLFLGALVYGRWGKKVAWYKTIFYCLVAGGAMVMIFASVVRWHSNLPVAAVLAMALGFIIGPIFIASNTIVHLVSDEKMRGKVFSALEMVIHFAFLSAMLVSSRLSEFVSSYAILLSVGGIFISVGLVGLWRYRKGGLATGVPGVA